MDNAEGNREWAKSQGSQPGVSACSPLPESKTGARARRVVQEPWEISWPPAQAGTTEGSEKPSEVGAREVGVPSTSRDAGEPARGTLRSKGRHRGMGP